MGGEFNRNLPIRIYFLGSQKNQPNFFINALRAI